MPAKVKVRILAGRNLPVMDKSSDASDAFVEVKLGNTTYKTEVYRRSLNPFWNSEWFMFEVSDQELQDEPLQIRIMDYDTYSANDAIGKVYINLNPLLVNPGRSMSGWLPIYDTLHGIRGEINCMVKVNLFADNNRYRHSSCGVRFFFSDIPNGYKCDAILGFVDELLVNDDPEYQWIDKIRTPRASNEARQTLFTKLSGEVQRKLGLKAEIFGGNAVIGYRQSLDLEGGSGIVGRGIGTAVVLSKIGYPYEGVISPFHTSNKHIPDIYKQNREISSSHRFPNAPRHLVHSVSADYFYEVPSKTISRKLLTTFDTPDSEYEDCEEVFEHSASDLNSDFAEPDVCETVSIKLAKRFPSLNRSINLLNSNEPKSRFSMLDRRRLSASSLITKLRQSNEIMSHKLANVANPISNSIKLTKLFPFRNKQAPLPPQIVENDKENHDHQTTIQSSLTQQKSTTSSKSTSSQSQVSSLGTSTSSSTIAKRRRDKSQSTSIDDALSIIEERFDDGDSSLQPPGGIRTRLLSSSSNKSRGMVKTKEIDLSDESDPITLVGAKGCSLSSIDDEDADDNATSSATIISSSTPTAKTTSANESLLSSSSPSTSNLTGETVKPRESLSRSKLISQSSTPTIHRSYEIIRRSDTDLIEKDSHHLTEVVSRTSLSRPESPFVAQNESKRLSPDPREGLQKVARGNDFVQSVRVVKAQQQLLHNMIRNQNQDLSLSSANRIAKNSYMYSNRVHESEYPFVTLKKYPDNMILCTGGVVSVHSVKLLDHIINDEESETRDIWWTEIRKEIRSHAKALNCNTILGYSETSKVLGDVCVLSASGTAAILRSVEESLQETCLLQQRINNQQSSSLKVPKLGTSPPPSHSAMPPRICTEYKDANSSLDEVADIPKDDIGVNSSALPTEIDCSFCHTPLNCVDSIDSLPHCTICNVNKVPDVLLLTIEPPSNLNIVSSVTMVQARVCRAKRDSHGEASAKEIGDALPFLEYELHRQLFSKLKFKGMNCLFSLAIDISLGENMIVGIATGTGCFVLGLPTPEAPKISAGKGIQTTKLDEIQRLIAVSAMKNREMLGLKQIEAQLAQYHETLSIGTCSSQGKVVVDQIIEAKSNLDLTEDIIPQSQSSIVNQDYRQDFIEPTTSYHNQHQHYHHHHHHQHRHHRRRLQRKAIELQDRNMIGPAENLLSDDRNMVLEVDDNEDADIIALLIDSDIPEGYLVCNSEAVSNISQSSITSINMFTQVIRVKLIGTDQFAQQFDWILQGLFVKLRRSLPCCLNNISFVVDLPESNIVQISVTGCLLGLPRVSGSTLVEGNSDYEGKYILAPSDNGLHQVSSSTSISQNPLSSPSSSSTSSSNSSSSSLETSSSTQATIAAVKQEILHNRQGGTGESRRTVFKKQHTYPGATSPAIGGQDRLLISNEPPSSSAINNKISSSATRRATVILNKVKQPLKELSANFNKSTTTETGTSGTTQVAIGVKTKTMNVSQQSTASNKNYTQTVRATKINESNQSRPISSRSLSERTTSIDITSLSYIPGAKEYHYLGNLSFSFVRETNSVRENGGLNGFIHCFLMEVYAIVRAHVSALGGNAFLSFRLQQSCIFYHSNKNQAQCLISVAGDAAQVVI